MKKTIIVLATMMVLVFSCTSRDNNVTIQDTYENGRPKTTIYKTIDDKHTFYKIRHDSLGRIEEITPYSDEQINGTKIIFRDLGVAALIPYKDGRNEGFTYEYYEGQQTGFKGEAKDDEFNGLSTWFYKNGRPKEAGIRINSKNEGEWIEYYENGQVKSKGTYINAIKQNDWKYWNNDGTIDTTKHD